MLFIPFSTVDMRSRERGGGRYDPFPTAGEGFAFALAVTLPLTKGRAGDDGSLLIYG
jgi:hypothetical protein